MTAGPETCEWFVRCMKPAIGDALHPILGLVPVCADDAARLDLTVIAPDERLPELE